MIEVKIYKTEDGKQPFIKWYDGLKDQTTKFRIRKRLRQVVLGNFGDNRALGNGIYELRFFFGKGYRIYYARDGDTIVLLLSGGDKSTQQKDIERAKTFWENYQRTK